MLTDGGKRPHTNGTFGPSKVLPMSHIPDPSQPPCDRLPGPDLTQVSCHHLRPSRSGTELISMLWLLSTPALPAQPPWLQTRCTLDSYFTSYHLPRVHPACCLPSTNSSLGRGPMGLPLWPVAGGCSLVPLGLAHSNCPPTFHPHSEAPKGPVG